MLAKERLQDRWRNKKLERLKKLIKEKGSLLVAFSGGVDSSLVAKVAYDVLRDKALAVTIDSEIYQRSELKDACKVASEIGIRHRIVRCAELTNPEFVKNPTDRCYHCKKEEAKILKEIAEKENIRCIADGVSISDFGEYRPGIRASTEEGIWHPLVAAGILKEDVRKMAEQLGLSVYNKPSNACLSSRIQYGEKITLEKLRKIETAEEFLKSLGFKQVRVRTHGEIVRIEVLKKELPSFARLELVEKITKKLKSLGFTYITLDLEGYRSGSMNEAKTV